MRAVNSQSVHYALRVESDLRVGVHDIRTRQITSSVVICNTVGGATCRYVDPPCNSLMRAFNFQSLRYVINVESDLGGWGS